MLVCCSNFLLEKGAKLVPQCVNKGKIMIGCHGPNIYASEKDRIRVRTQPTWTQLPVCALRT